MLIILVFEILFCIENFLFSYFNRWYPQSNINISIFIYIKQLSHKRTDTRLDEGFSLWLHIAVIRIINLRWFICFIYKRTERMTETKHFDERRRKMLIKIIYLIQTVTVWFIAKNMKSHEINKSMRMLCHSIWVLRFCHFYAKTSNFIIQYIWYNRQFNKLYHEMFIFFEFYVSKMFEILSFSVHLGLQSVVRKVKWAKKRKKINCFAQF